MKYILHKKLNVTGLRYPRIINNFLIGSKEHNREDHKVKYCIYMYTIDDSFTVDTNSGKFIDLSKIVPDCFNNINLSFWLRNCHFKNNKYYCLIECKYNLNNETFCQTNLLITTPDFETFNLEKIIDTKSKYFVFDVVNNNIILGSDIIKENDYFWGRYLFKFRTNGKIIQPKFDKLVDYKKDKGHLLHSTVYDNNTNCDNVLFSIRHQLDDGTFMYKVYTAHTQDYRYFFDTQEIEIDLSEIGSEWFCYPSIYDDYIVCNQDDFGKNKEVLVLKRV